MKKTLIILGVLLLLLQTSCFLKKSEQKNIVSEEATNTDSVFESLAMEDTEQEDSVAEDSISADSDYEKFYIKKGEYEFSVTEELANNDSTFEKLGENEYLQYKYENKCLSIFAVVEDGESRLIKQSDNVFYGNYRISQDKTKIAYLENSDGKYKPLYLVDGSRGTVKYIFNVREGFRCDGDMAYVAFNDSPIYSLKKDYNELYAEHIVIAPFENFSNDNTVIEWNLHNKYGSVFSYISIDSDYDFRFIYDSEKLLYAEAFYNIEDNVFDIKIDVTGEISEHPFEYKITSAEGGW